MQNDLTESVQSSIRPGEMVDTYYYGDSNTEKQAYPAVVNTRFVQNFTQLGAGSSQFVISPNMGVSDIVCAFQTPATAPGNTNYTLLALNQGWGYSLINRVSVRYGSSAQYFFTGQQIFLQNLFDCENGPKQDAVLQQGGQSVAGANCGNQYAYVYLKLPHNSIRSQGKPLPFPSDLLVQPIVITVELFALNSIMINQSANPASQQLAIAPAALQSATMQVKQEMLTDTSDTLARRVDMNTHAATVPLMYFAQQEIQVQVAVGADPNNQSVNLTGFRAGEVKAICLWLTNANQNNPGTGLYAPLNWPFLNSVQLTYNGEVFTRYDQGSSVLWNLSENERQTAISVGLNTAGSVATSTAVSYWTECPFAQVYKVTERDSKLVHGKPILNAVVNLQFNAPAANATFILHAMYIYNASLLCSRGSSEYIF